MSLLLLSTLSNQDRELHKETVLSAQRTHKAQDPAVLIHTLAIVDEGTLPIPALSMMPYTTKQANHWNTLKRKRQRSLLQKKTRKELVKCADVEMRNGIANCQNGQEVKWRLHLQPKHWFFFSQPVWNCWFGSFFSCHPKVSVFDTLGEGLKNHFFLFI